MNEDLKFNIKTKLYKLGSDSLVEKDYKKLQDYINTLSEKELVIFNNLFEQFYHYKKYNNYNKYKITSTAIKLTIKISEQTPLRVFPYIEKIATKGWSVKWGTYSFGMYLINEGFNERCIGDRLYSNSWAKDFMKKSTYIDYFINDIGDTEISAEDISKK